MRLAVLIPPLLVLLLILGSVAGDVAMLVDAFGAEGVLIFLAFPALVLIGIAIDRG